jgi:hypothetical protein
MKFKETLIAYHYLLNLGFIESVYKLHDTSDTKNPIYKFYGSTCGEIPAYERFRNLHLTKESIVNVQIEEQQESIRIMEETLKNKKTTLLELKSFMNGELIDFNSIGKS